MSGVKPTQSNFFFFKTDGRGEGGDRRGDDGNAEESGGRAELIYC